MTYYQLSALINFISSLAIGLLVYIKNPKNALNKSFSLFALSVAFWSWGYLFWQLTDDPEKALLYCRILMAGAAFISPAFFHFVTILLDLNKQRNYRKLIYLAYSLAFLLLLADFSPLFVTGISSNKYFDLWPEPGSLYPLFLLVFFLYALYAWLLMVLKYKTFTGNKRNQIKYILMGTIIGYIGGSTNYPLWYKIPIPPLGNCLVSAYVILIGYAIAKYKLLDVHFIIRKTITNLLWILVTTCIICLFYYPTINLRTIGLGFIIAALLVIYIPGLKIRTEDFITRLIYKRKYDYLDHLDKFIEKMVMIQDEEELFKEIIGVLARELNIEDGAILIVDPISNNYLLRKKIGLDQADKSKLTSKSKIVAWLKENKKSFVIEEIEKVLAADNLATIKEELAPLQAKVCVPALLDKDLLAIISLNNKTTGEMYTHVDLNLLERLGIQLAIALDYRRIENQVRKEQELTAMGILAMEIGHEMRNLLVAPYTFVDMIDQRKDDPDFMNDFKSLAMDRLRVIRGKLDDIMYFGKQHSVSLTPGVELAKLIDDTLLANEYGVKSNNITIERNYNGVPPIKGDHDHLVHLFNNLILNAIDAMANKTEKSGKLRISTKSNNNITQEMLERSNKWIRVEIKDDGEGIPENIKNRLFTPFVTTKSGSGIQRKGTGLGLSVVKKAVDAHKGYIYVNTKEGKGTTMIVDLPIDLKLTA